MLSVRPSVRPSVCHTVIDDGAEGTIIPSSPQVSGPEGLVLEIYPYLRCGSRTY